VPQASVDQCQSFIWVKAGSGGFSVRGSAIAMTSYSMGIHSGRQSEEKCTRSGGGR